MISIVTTSGVSFPQLEQDTISNAAVQSGVILGYGCRMGRFSSYKCKVINGDTVSLVDEEDLRSKMSFFLLLARVLLQSKR